MVTIISSLFAFIFAIILFYMTQHEKERMEKVSLANLLKRELEYNMMLIDEYIKYIKQDMYFLAWAKPIYTFTPRYDLFQNIFIDKAFESGIIYELLDNIQVKIIIELLSSYNKDRKQIILDRIIRFKNSETDYDEEWVPTTGKDYVEMYLQDQLDFNKRMQDNIKQIIPLIKYEETKLSEMITQVICKIKKQITC